MGSNPGWNVSEASYYIEEKRNNGKLGTPNKKIFNKNKDSSWQGPYFLKFIDDLTVCTEIIGDGFLNDFSSRFDV